jgi:hypothetical protein
MEPTLSYSRQTIRDGTQDYGQPVGSTYNQKNLCKLLGHHSNNPKVQQQNMVLPVINPTSANITQVMLVINPTSPTKTSMEFQSNYHNT